MNDLDIQRADHPAVYGTVQRRKGRKVLESERVRTFGLRGVPEPGLVSMFEEAWAQGVEEIRALRRGGVTWGSDGRITKWPVVGRVARLNQRDAQYSLLAMRRDLPDALRTLYPEIDPESALAALGLEV